MSGPSLIETKLAASWIGRLVRFARSGGIAAAEREKALLWQLLECREAVAVLREENAVLKRRMAKAEEFVAEAEQYVPVTLSTAAIVYVARGSDAEKARGRSVRDLDRGESRNLLYYCAHCFERRRKSLLQPVPKANHRRCQECGSEIPFPHPSVKWVSQPLAKRR